MKRLLMVMLSIAAAAWVCGCEITEHEYDSPVGPATQVRCRVFEVAAGDADAVVIGGSRRPVAESPYQVAVVPMETIERLTQMTLQDSGLLNEHVNEVNQFGRSADGWQHARQNDQVSGVGAGSGFLAVRRTGPSRELHVDYHVNHFMNPAGAVEALTRIDGPIFFDDKVQDDQAVVFLAPFKRSDGRQVTHLIAFNVDRPK
jgi:hypothetical protein